MQKSGTVSGRWANEAGLLELNMSLLEDATCLCSMSCEESTNTYFATVSLNLLVKILISTSPLNDRNTKKKKKTCTGDESP